MTAVWKLTLEENRLPDVGADDGHGVKVRESLLVLQGDGQQSTHVLDLMIDVVPSSFGCPFGGSVRDHGHWGQKAGLKTKVVNPMSPNFCLFPHLHFKQKTKKERCLSGKCRVKKQKSNREFSELILPLFSTVHPAWYLFPTSQSWLWISRVPMETADMRGCCASPTEMRALDRLCVISICLDPSTESLGFL